MKTTRFLVAALIAVGLMACQTEDIPYVNPGDGSPATVSITIFSDTPQSRSTDAGLPAERAIHTLEVWLFASNGNVVGHQFFAAGDLREIEVGGNVVSYVAEGIEAASGQLYMIAVANRAQIGSVNRNVLQGTLAGGLTQDLTGGMIMTSEQVALTLMPGHNFFGVYPDGTFAGNHISPTANLQLVRVNARISLVNVQFENALNDERFDAFELVEVAMFNVRNNSRLFGTTSFATSASLVYGTGDNAFSFGAPYPTTMNTYVDGILEPTLARALGAVTYSQIATNPIHFYVYENTGDRVETNNIVTRPAGNGTFIVLKGRFTLNGAPVTSPSITDGEFSYFAIWVNDASFGAAGGTNVIRRNTQYNISVNIRGAGNPSIDPSDNAFLDVHVEVAPWEVVNQDVVWGPPVPTCPMEMTQNVVQSYVLIGGVRWATVNVCAPGTFAATPQSPGLMYQWGRNIGWEFGPGANHDTTDPTTFADFTGINYFAPEAFVGTATWQTNDELATVNEWNPIAGTPYQRGPCPTGWRLPTQAELQAFLPSVSGVNAGEVVGGANPGRWVGGDMVGAGFTTANIADARPYRIFIPATGGRDIYGEWRHQPTHRGGGAALEGAFWTSTVNAGGIPISLHRVRNGTGQAPVVGTPTGTGMPTPGKAIGKAVRCVMHGDWGATNGNDNCDVCDEDPCVCPPDVCDICDEDPCVCCPANPGTFPCVCPPGTITQNNPNTGFNPNWVAVYGQNFVLPNLGAAQGGTVAFTYQWQSSADGTTWANIVGATTYDRFPMSAHRYYRRVATSGSDSHTSVALELPATLTIFANQNVGLPGTFAASGIGYMYIWGINEAWEPGAAEINITNPAVTAWPALSAIEGINNDWDGGVGPCPPGWRLPTVQQFNNLVAKGHERDGLVATIFGAAPNQLALPATGRRNGNGAGAWGMTDMGFFFATPPGALGTTGNPPAETGAGRMNRLQTHQTGGGLPHTSPNDRTHGQFVRCVQPMP